MKGNTDQEAHSNTETKMLRHNFVFDLRHNENQ